MARTIVSPQGRFSQDTTLNSYSDWVRDGQYRLRTSQFRNIADYRFTSPIARDRQWVTQVTGTGTDVYDPNTNSRTLSVTDAGVGSVILQSAVRYTSIPPYPIIQWFEFKDFFALPGAGFTKRVGAYDDNTGIYVQVAGTAEPAFVIFNNLAGINITIPQSEWDNPFDGTGEYELVANADAVSQYTVEYSWAAGYARFGVNVEGIPYVLHTEYFGNIQANPPTAYPSLPLRFEIIGDGTENGSITVYSAAVQEDASAQSRGIIRSVDRGRNTEIAVNASYHSIIGIRSVAGAIEAAINLRKFSLVCSTGGNIHYVLVYDPVPDAALTWSPLPDSPIEFTTPPSSTEFTYDIENVIVSGYFSNNSDGIVDDITDNLLTLGQNVDGSPANEIHLLAANATAGGDESVIGGLQFIQQL